MERETEQAPGKSSVQCAAGRVQLGRTVRGSCSSTLAVSESRIAAADSAKPALLTSAAGGAAMGDGSSAAAAAALERSREGREEGARGYIAETVRACST